MRLTCPNCSAQYDIPEDMVPEEGREVQCSNCATVWFQAGAAGETAPGNPASQAEGDERRPLADESTLDVLRQERAHEARLRAAERRRTRILTRQNVPTDPPVNDPDTTRAAAAAERVRMGTAASVARARDEAPPPEPDLPSAVPTVADDVSDAIARTLREMSQDRPTPIEEPDVLADPDGSGHRRRDEDRRQARRDLLPDIEEINSSLRPDERAFAAAEEEDDLELGEIPRRVDRRSGFSLGFTLILILVAIGVALYFFAVPLGEAVPQIASALTSYVETVDSWRVALEARVDAVAAAILQSQ